MSKINFINPATTHGLLLIIVSIFGMYLGLLLAWLALGVSLIIFFLGIVIGVIRNKRDALVPGDEQ
jgi:hypothetical protein